MVGVCLHVMGIGDGWRAITMKDGALPPDVYAPCMFVDTSWERGGLRVWGTGAAGKGTKWYRMGRGFGRRHQCLCEAGGSALPVSLSVAWGNLAAQQRQG